MTRISSARRPAYVAVPLLAVLALGAAGCGGDAKAEKTPSPSPATTSATPTPTPSPTATPTPPLSAFEDRPQVKVARQALAAAARDINAKAKDLPRTRPFLDADGRGNFPRYASEDIGLYYPGPLPFTPVAVRPNAVVACVWVSGWAQNPKTHKPAHPKLIRAERIEMTRVKGAWKLSAMVRTEADCNSVTVKGVTW